MRKRSLSDRVFRFLLGFLPVDFQREFGSEMEDVFRQERSDAHKIGRVRTIRLWWTAVLGLLRVAPVEHFDVFRRDVQYGLRSLRNNPGFVWMAIVALGIGMGANLTIFGFANALLMRPVPAPNPDEVIRVYHNRWANVPYSAYVQYRDRNQTTSGLAAFENLPVNLRADAQPELVWAMKVTGNYFDVLQIKAAHGRTISESDDRPGAPGVVMLSDAFWRRRFGGDSSVLGRTVSIGGAPATVIGITPASFNGTLAPFVPQVWIPWNGNYRDVARSANVIGRLRPGATLKQVWSGAGVAVRETRRRDGDEE
jgi:hypothetical protein